jgi:hypothetical protein
MSVPTFTDFSEEKPEKPDRQPDRSQQGQRHHLGAGHSVRVLGEPEEIHCWHEMVFAGLKKKNEREQLIA